MVLAEIGSFERPTHVTSDPQDPNRLFVVEQAGRIKQMENGTTTTFLDIAPLVHPLNPTGDYGTFSIAFSPNYAEDGFFYVTYSGVDDPATTTEDETGDWHLDEFRAEGDTADPSSRRAVLTIEYEPTPGGSRGHYGGQLQSGPDGYLYASTGDGLPQGDPNGNAQNLELLFGKILRIDPQGSTPGEYTVPADNPFADTTSCSDGCDEIWSYGLRHPWRFSFDRLTGDLAVGDVGWHDWEEVNFSTGPDPGKGDNFGWNCREGAHPGPGETSVPPADVCTARAGTFTEPVFEYAHDPACSVTGGYVVRDPALDDLYGRYLYADFCVGELRSLELGLPMAAGDRSEGLTVPRPTSFGEDAIGRIYIASFEGPVYRLEPDCDNDGLGDESQDSDLSACAPAPPGAGSAPLGAAPGPSGAASSGHFDLAKLKRNQKKGIAHVAFDLPGPGAVGLKGNGLVRIRLGPGLARESRAVAGGRVWLKVAPAKKGKQARRIREALERKGKAKVRFRVTYVPTSGVAATQSKRLKLKKR